MTFIEYLRRDWLSNVRGDVLAGIVVALALIPEAIGFSIIAGVDPKVALYASFSIAVIISITGGRPGMISAATAATAVLMITLVRDHGLEYLLAATILANSSHSTRNIKAFVRHILDGQCDDDAETRATFAAAFTGADFIEGTTAFVGKRKPRFG